MANKVSSEQSEVAEQQAKQVDAGPRHTPGPWRSGHYGEYGFRIDTGPDTNYVAHVSPRLDDPETEANARLIAAAPDLLEALEFYAAHQNHVDYSVTDDVGVIARAAIAKATEAPQALERSDNG